MLSNLRASGRREPPSLTRPRFVARVLSASDVTLLTAAQRLRAAVFARELGWAPECACGREHDRCDPVATHLVVLSSSSQSAGLPPRAPSWQVAGYTRILLPEQTFMLHREFAALAPDGLFIREPARCFEVSRFVAHPALRGALDAGGRSVAEHLQRGIARWALAHHRDQLYSVCETRHVRALRFRGLPVRRIGRALEYTPGVRTCAIHLELDAAHRALTTHRPWDAGWYEQGVNAC